MKLVLAAATMGAAQAFVAPSAFSGVSLSTSRVAAATSTPRMSLSEYKEELAATANAIASPGEDPHITHGVDRVVFLFAWMLRVYQFMCPRGQCAGVMCRSVHMSTCVAFSREFWMCVRVISTKAARPFYSMFFVSDACVAA